MFKEEIIYTRCSITDSNDKDIVSLCVIRRYEPRFNKIVFFIESFGIRQEEYLHKGYGRRLLKQVIEKYKGNTLMLRVGSGMGQMTQKQLINFYMSEGFNFASDSEKLDEFPLMICKA